MLFIASDVRRSQGHCLDSVLHSVNLNCGWCFFVCLRNRIFVSIIFIDGLSHWFASVVFIHWFPISIVSIGWW